MESHRRGASSNNDVLSASNVPQAAIVVWIIAAAATIGEAYNFTIWGDCELGLCLTIMFTVEEYAALLLASKVVKVKKKRAGGYIVATSDTDIWNPLLERYYIWGPDNTPEATIAKVKVDAFK